MENQSKIELLMELISILSKKLKKSFYSFKLKENSVTFKSFESLDSHSLFRDLKNIISLYNHQNHLQNSDLKANFHLNPKDKEITLSW